MVHPSAAQELKFCHARIIRHHGDLGTFRKLATFVHHAFVSSTKKPSRVEEVARTTRLSKVPPMPVFANLAHIPLGCSASRSHRLTLHAYEDFMPDMA